VRVLSLHQADRRRETADLFLIILDLFLKPET
jgi:hypothetical protein